jgi:hypothetical protein
MRPRSSLSLSDIFKTLSIDCKSSRKVSSWTQNIGSLIYLWALELSSFDKGFIANNLSASLFS